MSRRGRAQRDAAELVDMLVEAIRERLTVGETVMISGFGSFSVHYRRGRVGRNPRTGRPVSIPSRYVPYFKPGKVLRERVDGATSDPHGEPGGA